MVWNPFGTGWILALTLLAVALLALARVLFAFRGFALVLAFLAMLGFSLLNFQAMKPTHLKVDRKSCVWQVRRQAKSADPPSFRWTIFESNDKAQARPGLIHGTNLVVDQAGRQANLAYAILRQVGGHSRGLLGPGNPQAPGRAEASRQGRKSSNQLLPIASKEYDYIESRSAAILVHAGAIGKLAQAWDESSGSIEDADSAILLDSQLDCQRRPGVAGHLA